MLKRYKEYISETSDNSVADMLQQFVTLTSGYQKEYYKKRLDCLNRVPMHSVHELFDKETADLLKRLGRFKKKECYANALHASEIIQSMGEVYILGEKVENPEVKYVEGYVLVFGIPIDHAFNRIGDHWFDVTMDFALGDKEVSPHYSVGEWNYAEALRMMCEEGFYGGLFDKVFRDTYKQNVS